jgi:murein DD-endopeptidase MepM/ murein hydrolase activator NlpD
MFFRTFIALTLLVAITGASQTGYASEPDLKIQEESIVAEDLSPYYMPFLVRSAIYPAVPYAQSIISPKLFWPTDSEEVVSGYGYRKASCKHCSSNHKGIDFTPGSGKPVYASLDGIISQIEYRGGFGLHVYIDHIVVINTETQHWRTVYAHLQKDSVPANLAVGQIIEAGTVIGAVGNTGTSTGPHLHFEIIVNDENVDPEKYLKMYANW